MEELKPEQERLGWMETKRREKDKPTWEGAGEGMYTMELGSFYN